MFTHSSTHKTTFVKPEISDYLHHSVKALIFPKSSINRRFLNFTCQFDPMCSDPLLYLSCFCIQFKLINDLQHHFFNGLALHYLFDFSRFLCFRHVSLLTNENSSWLISKFVSTLALHKKWSFPLRISSVNVTKSGVSCGFDHIYWRNP